MSHQKKLIRMEYMHDIQMSFQRILQKSREKYQFSYQNFSKEKIQIMPLDT